MTQGVRITESFAQRIASTVRRVDAMSLVTGDGKIPTRFEDGPVRPTGGGGGGGVEAYYTGGWVKGATKQIRFLASTATTASAVNLLRTVPIASGQTARWCLVCPRSTDSTTYVLINTEC